MRAIGAFVLMLMLDFGRSRRHPSSRMPIVGISCDTSGRTLRRPAHSGCSVRGMPTTGSIKLGHPTRTARNKHQLGAARRGTSEPRTFGRLTDRVPGEYCDGNQSDATTRFERPNHAPGPARRHSTIVVQGSTVPQNETRPRSRSLIPRSRRARKHKNNNHDDPIRHSVRHRTSLRRCGACAAATTRRPHPAASSAAPTAAPASSTSIPRRAWPPATSAGSSAASTDPG